MKRKQNFDSSYVGFQTSAIWKLHVVCLTVVLVRKSLDNIEKENSRNHAIIQRIHNFLENKKTYN